MASAASSSRPYLGARFFARACSTSCPSQLSLRAAISSAMVHFFSSKTRYLTARSESTVVAKVTASMVVKLISAPPWVTSRPFSAHPFTRQERYGVRKNRARAASDVS